MHRSPIEPTRSRQRRRRRATCRTCRTGNFADIEKVYATPIDHAACVKFFGDVAPKVRVHDVKSPQLACQLAREDHGAAALATASFGEQFELATVKKSIRDGGDEKV